MEGCGSLILPLSVSLVEVVGLVSTLLWNEAIHQVQYLWNLTGTIGQGQPLPMCCLGPPNMSYKVIFRWLLFVLGLVVPRRGQAVNQGQLLLVPGLGLLSGRYRVH